MCIQLGYVPTTMPCVGYWDQLLSCAADLFESRSALFRAIACIRNALPQVTDAIAFCALAECAGDVSDAMETLHGPSYEREVSYVCTVIDVAKLLQGFDGAASNNSRGSGGLLPSASLSPRLSSEPSSHKMFTSATPDSPMRFPAITSATVAPHVPTSETTTTLTSSGFQTQNTGCAGGSEVGTTSPRTPRRVMLPPCVTQQHQELSGMKGSLTSPAGGKHSGVGGGAIADSSRLGDMIESHFHERNKPQFQHQHAMTSPLLKAGTSLHAHSTESIAVLHDFRHANTALLLSQQSFGGER